MSAAAALVAGLAPALAAPVVAAGPATSAPSGSAGALAVPSLASAATPAAVPASDVRQPTVREVALKGIDGRVLASAPSPNAQGDGQVSAMSVKTQLKPALAATLRLSKKRAAALVAVVADQPFPDGTSIQLRVKDRSGWSAWTSLGVDADHGPDPGSPEAVGSHPGSDPMLAIRARRIRVRIDTPTGRLPQGTRLSLVKSRAAPSDVRTGQMTAMAAVGQPPIVTRAQWGADESWRSREPYYTDNIRVGFVHHTASTSNYPESQAAAQIRAIYAYHTKSLGHSDIDYNYVVDRFGRLYEGRYGGVSRPVLGGHTAGFNEHTFAVVALGNFDSFNPPAADMAAMKDSIARLFAWKLGLYGIRPDSTERLVSAGYIKATRYPKGTVANLPAISSHQMVNYTACPGRYLQAELESIRQLAASYSHVVLSAPSPGGQTVQSGSAEPVSFTSSADRAVAWQADILSPCTPDPIRTFTGSTEGPGPVEFSWDLRDSTGAPVLPATYTVRMSGTTADGAPVADVTADLTVAPAPGGQWGPCAGAGRVLGDGLAATSVLWGRALAPKARTVILTGDSDTLLARSAAMVAAPLARSLRAPLLMTPRDALAREVAGDIRARGADRVLVVGGARVVSDFVVSSLELLGVQVARLGGATRNATALAVAATMDPSTGAVLVSPNGSPAHALAGSALAAARGVPLLLANGGSVPRAARLDLAARPSVTVASSGVLSDAAVGKALVGVPWDRVEGSGVVGAALAVADAFPSVRRAALLPESPSTWAAGPIPAAYGMQLLFTSAALLTPEVVDHLGTASSLHGVVTPVGSLWLDDGVLGQARPSLTRSPWSPAGVTLPRGVRVYTSVRQVGRADASPEPVRRGNRLVVRAQVLAERSDGTWRKVRRGEPFVVQFKRKGQRYVTVASGTTGRGWARAVVTASRSGYWRIVVGPVKSRRDFVRARR